MIGASDNPFQSEPLHQAAELELDSSPFIEALKRLDNEAWRKLFRRAYPMIVSTLYKRGVLRLEDAEDLAQKTFIKAERNISGFELREDGSIIGWLVLIAKRTAIDWFKAKKRDLADTSLDEPVESESGLTIGDTIAAPEKSDAVDTEAIRKAVLMLWETKPKCAEVLELKIFVDLKFHEIADRLQINEDTARSRYYQCAIPELARILREMEGSGSGRKP